MTRSGAVPTRQLAAYHCAAYHCAAYHCAAYHWAANRMIPTVKARLQRGAVVLRKKTGQEFGDCVAAGSSCRCWRLRSTDRSTTAAEVWGPQDKGSETVPEIEFLPFRRRKKCQSILAI
jgi:hypothetical protein